MNRETVALGSVAAASVVAGAVDPTGLALAAFGALLVVVLAGATLRSADELAVFAVSLGALVAVLGLARSAGWSTPETAAALALTGVVAGYGLHRYELVTMGLVEA